MSLADDYTAGLLRKWLRDRIEQYSASIVTGSLDQADYRSKCGYVQGLKHTLEQLTDIERSMNK